MMVRVAMPMATVMRVAGDKEGEGRKVMAMATRVVQLMPTATKRLLATATRVTGDKEGNGDCNKEEDSKEDAID
jgi:hypothetical protein